MQKRSISLSIPVDTGMIPVVTGFVENSGYAFGLMRRECLALTLAAEEVFAFIAGSGAADNDIQIICRSGGYYMEMAFQLRSGLLPLDAFNLTRHPVTADLDGAEQLGLILASRAVDRLAIDRSGKDTFVLRFIMDKRYPAVEPATLPEPDGFFKVMEADAAALAELSSRILRLPQKAAYAAAPFLTVPGKLIDMAASGDVEVLVALNEKGRVGGGIVYTKSRQMSEAYGPYVFGGNDDLPRVLVEKMLEKLGRAKDALCLVMMTPTPQTPMDYFETLPGGAFYRQLSEDNGARVFAHPCFNRFLNDFYQTLALPRTIQDVAHLGEELAQHSAIAAAIDRQSRKSELSLLWAGQNLEDNLRAHVELLQTQNIEEISFWMRLGSAEEAMTAPQVLAAGFEPVTVLPWARQGDVAVFRYRGRE